MEEVSTKEFLDTLESGYNIFDSMFLSDTEDLLLADQMLEENVLEDLNIPLTAMQYLSFLKR